MYKKLLLFLVILVATVTPIWALDFEITPCLEMYCPYGCNPDRQNEFAHPFCCGEGQYYDTESEMCQCTVGEPCKRLCCQGDTPICNQETLECESCPEGFTYNLENKQCECLGTLCGDVCCQEDTPICNSETHQCESCPDGQSYDPEEQKCLCIDGLTCGTQCCKEDTPICNSELWQCEGCPEGQVYNTTEQKCECVEGQVCGNVCCQGDTPICDLNTQECRSCKEDQECPGVQVCAPIKYMCSVNRMEANHWEADPYFCIAEETIETTLTTLGHHNYPFYYNRSTNQITNFLWSNYYDRDPIGYKCACPSRTPEQARGASCDEYCECKGGTVCINGTCQCPQGSFWATKDLDKQVSTYWPGAGYTRHEKNVCQSCSPYSVYDSKTNSCVCPSGYVPGKVIPSYANPDDMYAGKNEAFDWTSFLVCCPETHPYWTGGGSYGKYLPDAYTRTLKNFAPIYGIDDWNQNSTWAVSGCVMVCKGNSDCPNGTFCFKDYGDEAGLCQYN